MKSRNVLDLTSIKKFTEGRTQEQWLQHLYAKMLAKDPALPSYDELKKMGIYKRKDPNGHFVAYKAFRDDPEANPLKTPSGKIEIYSSKLAEIARTWELEKDEVISPLPVYASTFEGWDSLNVVPSHCNCLVSITNPVRTRPTATLMS